MERWQVSGLVLVDLRAAFDTIVHNINDFNYFPHTSTHWLRALKLSSSFLLNCTHSTSTSKPAPLLSRQCHRALVLSATGLWTWVPQGSGPEYHRALVLSATGLWSWLPQALVLSATGLWSWVRHGSGLECHRALVSSATGLWSWVPQSSGLECHSALVLSATGLWSWVPQGSGLEQRYYKPR